MFEFFVNVLWAFAFATASRVFAHGLGAGQVTGIALRAVPVVALHVLTTTGNGCDRQAMP